MVTGRQAVFESLAAEGVERGYGLPGGPMNF